MRAGDNVKLTFWQLDFLSFAPCAREITVQKLQILQKLYLKNYKKLMRDKIPEIGKMSPEELQGADLCSKIANVAELEHERQNCRNCKNVARRTPCVQVGPFTKNSRYWKN